MPEVARSLLIHQDSQRLTYHDSVSFPDVVPVYVDCNENLSVGRAHVRHEDGNVWVDLHLDEEFPGIPRPFQCIIGCNPQTQLFHSEDGTTYLIYGGIESIAVMSTHTDAILAPGEEDYDGPVDVF